LDFYGITKGDFCKILIFRFFPLVGVKKAKNENFGLLGEDSKIEVV